MVVYSTQPCILITQVHGKVPQESPFLIPFTAVLVALCNKACNCVALLLVMEGSCHILTYCAAPPSGHNTPAMR